MPILAPGEYAVAVAVADGTQAMHVQHHWVHDALAFRSVAPPDIAGLMSVPMQAVRLESMAVVRAGEPACPVCGGLGTVESEVLWPALIAAWELAAHEIDCINRQQGSRCAHCGCNVKSQALAEALLRHLRWDGTLDSLVSSKTARQVTVLEVNEAGTLTPWLSRLPGHRLVRFPGPTFEQLRVDDGAFNLVVHSDTLEHVARPRVALAECRRVLAAGGACAFTVPLVIGRMSRGRAGLPASSRGSGDPR